MAPNYGVFNKHMTFVLIHQKFTTGKQLTLQALGLSAVNSPNLELESYVRQIHLVSMVSMLHMQLVSQSS